MSMNRSLVELSPAALHELPLVLNLWKEAGQWLNGKGISQWDVEALRLEDVLDYYHNDQSEIFIARYEGDIAGSLVVLWSDPAVWSDLDDGQAGYIHKLVINRAYAAQGIGKELLELAGEYIADRGRNAIRLDCMEKNKRLNSYYKELNFKFIRCKESWGINLYEKALR
ncbi:GNAT family N-acetyltransferase [Paenibacillus sp. SN-8-1]|uniref:GNAT family N-acetyltransferase n=1 Tax=Paenibacillus sp. SN-8-1 TaxID=3435409 RepID=UPI003D9A264B